MERPLATGLPAYRLDPVGIEAVVGDAFLVEVEHALPGPLSMERHLAVVGAERVVDRACWQWLGLLGEPPASEDRGTPK